MWIVCLVLTLLVYSTYAFISYYDGMRHKWWFVYAILGLSNIGCVVYVWLAKITQDNNELYFRNLIWDFLVVISFVAVPILMGAVRINWMMVFGVILVATGLVILKVNQ